MSANTASVRDDFFQEKLSDKEFFALFDGIVNTGGSLVMLDNKISLELTLSDKGLAFYLIERLSHLIDCELGIDRESTEGISQGRYLLSIPAPYCFSLLEKTNSVRTKDGVMTDFVDNSAALCPDKLFRFYLRGLFWTRGNLFTPEDDKDEMMGGKGSCRIEINGLDEMTAGIVQKRLSEKVIGGDGYPVEINLNIQQKGKSMTLYSSSMETICNLLALLGATGTVLDFNNLIMVRQIRNSTNRQANCDFGNALRTSEAGARQVEAIRKLQQSSLWGTLDEKLVAVATLRLTSAEATVRELAEQTGLSRSGVYHRLAKLEELADTIK